MSEHPVRQSGSGAMPPPAARRHPRFSRRQRGLARLALLVAVIAVGAFELLARGSGAQQTARQFVAAWAQRDWSALYGDVDAKTQHALSSTEFANDYARALEIATVAHVTVLPKVRSVGGLEVVGLRIKTRIFGTLNEEFRVPLTHSGGQTRVLWNSGLVFPGLFAGETLHRVTTAPQRGELLARDRVPLATLSAAGGIVGSVGPATGSQLAALVADGFPADTPVGQDGLEAVFQNALAGTPGGELLAGARVLANSPAKPGAQVVTSIDPELQIDATELFDSVDSDDAGAGGIVVMAPGTGELLALAGTPLSQLQPPGSTFKMVTVTGVLNAHLATAESTYPDSRYALIDGYKLHNSADEDCGGTLANAFAVSCNSVFAPLGVELGAARLVATAEVYGFNSPSPLPIAAESTMPAASEIDGGVELGSSAIGQYQDLASPLQMARIAATIALDGREPVPTFDVRVRRTFPRVISVAVAHTIRQMMLDVVRYGTGTAAQIPGVEVAGKTGTAQLTVPQCPTVATGASGATGVPPDSGATGSTGPCANIQNNPYDTDAWFVSFAPAYDPTVVVGVLFDHDGMGGTAAAPVARDLIEDALPLLAKR